ncbi:MAG: ABC transporter permease [Bacillota bacterium]|nr:ABC transporter permease [Bacillota bacterium]
MALFIALKDLRVVLRDRRAILMLLLMPSIIIFILGTALGSVFNQNLAVNKFSIAVVNNDEGYLSSVFINEVLRDGMSDTFNTFPVDKEKAEDMFNKKTVPAVITIPENFSKDIDSNKQVRLDIKTRLGDKIDSVIVKSVAESFANNISMSYASANAVMDIEKQYKFNIPANGMTEAQMVMSGLRQKLGNEMLKFSEEPQKKYKTTTAIQYYSAAMLVMFILFGANTGTRSIVEERENKTLGRLMSTRASKVSLISGKTMGIFMVCLAQALTLIIFTCIVYGVNWGQVAGTLLVTVSAVFAASGFGVVVAALVKTARAADGVGMLVIQLSTMMSGGMVPIPSSMKTMSMFTINWWAHQAYIDLMVGSGISAVLPYCGVLAAIGLVLMSIGVARFRT